MGVAGVDWIVGCHTISIGKEYRLSNWKSLWTFNLSCFNGNWSSRLRRSLLVLHSHEHKIKIRVFPLIWRYVELYRLDLLHIFSSN